MSSNCRKIPDQRSVKCPLRDCRLRHGRRRWSQSPTFPSVDDGRGVSTSGLRCPIPEDRTTPRRCNRFAWPFGRRTSALTGGWCCSTPVAPASRQKNKSKLTGPASPRNPKTSGLDRRPEDWAWRPSPSSRSRSALQKLYPSGTAGVGEGEVLRTVFVTSCDGIRR